MEPARPEPEAVEEPEPAPEPEPEPPVSFPADMPPPAAPAVDVEEPEPESEAADLDAGDARAMSREDRKLERAALRREKQEARAAARQAKAQAKAAAKGARMPEPVVPVVPEPGEAEEAEVDSGPAEQLEREPRDARARAAQRVQRRVGRDAERLSAAEVRAKAREEARQRRAQAKTTSAGVSAEEPVARDPDEPTAEVPVVDADVVEQETALLEVPEQETVVDAEPVVVTEPAPEAAPEAGPESIVEPQSPKPESERYVPPPSARIQPEVERKRESRWEPDRSPYPAADEEDLAERPLLAQIAGLVGLLGLVLSVVLAVGALLVAVGTEFSPLAALCDAVVGPLKNAFDFSGTGAERKENFLAWGAGSVLYLLISFVGQAVQRASSDAE